ncbi:TIGR02221 family CRISPR-associated protein [Sporolactobacillus sp. Y61]|uniref:TIGR02221 family CRISPR-associated protein n=1 Tax=Sporolactobacillus sp. Y61 TaxID=3160863 RepID=A0AAU8IIS6_9BACL
MLTIGRNILFSFLGTTDYKECIYTWHGQESRPTRFVQTAIIEHLMRMFEHLEVVIFVTEDALKKNWEDGFYEDEAGEAKRGLKSCLRTISGIRFKKVLIENAGQSETDHWKLFDLISSEIYPNATIYFDITHSLRPNPIVALAVINYARVIKKARYGKFLYGRLDDLSSVNHGIKGSEGKYGHARIIDFSPMMRLLDWTNGVDQFLRTGDAGRINDIVREIQQSGEIRERPLDEREQLDQLQTIADSLKDAGLSLTTVRGHSMKPDYPMGNQVSYVQALKHLRSAINNLTGEKSTPLYPLKRLIGEINRKFEGFGENEAMDLFYAARWCFENGRIQQSYTFLEENIKTLLCRIHGLHDNNRHDREVVKTAIMNYKNRQIPKVGLPLCDSHDVETANRVIATLAPYGNLFSEKYDQLRRYRNNMNHASMDHSNLKIDQLSRTMEKLLNHFKVFFQNEGLRMKK